MNPYTILGAILVTVVLAYTFYLLMRREEEVLENKLLALLERSPGDFYMLWEQYEQYLHYLPAHTKECASYKDWLLHMIAVHTPIVEETSDDR